jgi:hypothetical protein
MESPEDYDVSNQFMPSDKKNLEALIPGTDYGERTFSIYLLTFEEVNSSKFLLSF